MLKASTRIIAVAEDYFYLDRIFIEDKGERNRGQLSDISRLYVMIDKGYERFIYSADRVLDRVEETKRLETE